MNVVIDTNVFISGILYAGLPEQILNLFRNSQFNVIVSPEIQAELINKLRRFNVSEETIDDLLYVLDEKAIRVLPSKKIEVVRDPLNNIFLEAATEGKAEYLITGDKDLLVLKKYKRILIVSPRQFLKITKLL